MMIDIKEYDGTLEFLKDVKAQIAALKEQQTMLEDKLKGIIGENNVGTMNGKPVAKYSSYETAVFRQKNFKDENPDMVARYTTIETRTRFVLIDEDQNV